MLKKCEVLLKPVEEGDYVIFSKYNGRVGRYQTDVGVIEGEFDDISWVVSGDVRLKDSILFVITVDGYTRQRLFGDSPVVTSRNPHQFNENASWERLTNLTV